MKINQVSPEMGTSEIENMVKSVNNGWLTEGPFTAEFLDRIKEITSADFVLPVNNGTLGLYLSLLTLGLEKGAEILVPSFTFFGSVSSIYFAGYKPVFVDVEPDSYMATAENFKNALTKNTRAIMPIHIYGMSALMDDIMDFARANNLMVIEDAAQAMGVYYKEQHCGTFGDIGVISFFADKTITMGEGELFLRMIQFYMKKRSL